MNENFPARVHFTFEKLQTRVNYDVGYHVGVRRVYEIEGENIALLRRVIVVVFRSTESGVSEK